MSDNPVKLAMNYLPEDIEICILSLCPVKSLLRFRCVCKSWRSIISDPEFIKRHLTLSNLSINRQHLLSAPYLIVSQPLYQLFSTLVGTCNGLVCFLMNDEELIVFNPSTRVYKQLPLPPETNLKDYDSYWGFGFDSSIDDYKLVLCFQTPRSTQTMVLSFKDSFWRITHTFHGDDSIRLSPSLKLAILLDGFLHWIALHHGRKFILSFDLSKEVFQEVPKPPPDSDGDICTRIGVIGGCLWLTRFDWNGVAYVGNLWAMKEYGVKSSWVKLFEIPLLSPGESLEPLFFLRNGEILVAWADWDMVAYYPESQQRIETGIRSPIEGMDLVLYTESLVSPTCGEDWRGNQQFMDFMAEKVVVLDVESLNLPNGV